MTTYGTIPTSSSPGGAPPSNYDYISRAKDRLEAGLGVQRSWREMFQLHSFALPKTTSDAIDRTKTNLSYFQMNYALIILLVIFLSLLWNPTSLIVFLIMMVAWLFFYFLRDEPLVVFHRTISDRVVMIVLMVFTVGLLLFTHATVNILVSFFMGVVLVLVHAVLRKMEDLTLDEEASGFLKAAEAVRGPPPPSFG